MLFRSSALCSAGGGVSQRRVDGIRDRLISQETMVHFLLGPLSLFLTLRIHFAFILFRYYFYLVLILRWGVETIWTLVFLLTGFLWALKPTVTFMHLAWY